MATEKSKRIPEEEVPLAAKWLTVGNLGMEEPRTAARADVERAFQRCAEAFYAEGLGIDEEYQDWLKSCRGQDPFCVGEWERFKAETLGGGAA